MLAAAVPPPRLPSQPPLLLAADHTCFMFDFD
jgi:hypothetical protein